MEAPVPRLSLPVLLSLLLFLVVPARAQERPGAVYVTGAVTVVHEAGVGGGVDLRLGGRHVAVLPSFRVHCYLPGEPGGTSRYPGGALSRWIVQGGLALRATF